MNENTIKEAVKKGERVTLECKKAMAEVPKSLWGTYSAFANTIGGLILLGVGTFRRNHEGDYHCNERQVKAMIRDSFEDGNDGLLIEHYGMDDIDFNSLHRYRTLFQYRNEGHVWNEIDDMSFLKNLGGYVVVRE